jgi:hypothetical protein
LRNFLPFLHLEFDHCLKDMPQQNVEKGRSCPANLSAFPPGSVQHKKPVILQLQESFVSRQLLRRFALGRQNQPARGIGLNFFC